MDTAINLDSQRMLRTVEIENERFHHVLAPELKIAQLAVAEMLPKQFLAGSGILAELHRSEVKFGGGAGMASGFGHSHGAKIRVIYSSAVKRPLTRFRLRRNVPLPTSWGEGWGLHVANK